MEHVTRIRRRNRSLARRLVAAALGIGLVLGGVAGADAVTGRGGRATAIVAAGAPSGRVAATVAGVPPRPSHVRLRTLKETHYAGGNGLVKARVTWTEPAGVATRFKVIGVLSCVHESARTNGKPCVVAHMRLRSRDLRVIATARGSARSVTFNVHLFGEVTTNALWGNSDFFGILLGAYNAHGESVLAIAASSTVCWGCTY